MDSDSDNSLVDKDFAITTSLLKEWQSDSEVDIPTDSDEEFLKNIKLRYGGKKEKRKKKKKSNQRTKKNIKKLPPSAQIATSSEKEKNTSAPSVNVPVDSLDVQEPHVGLHFFGEYDDEILSNVMQQSLEEAKLARTVLMSNEESELEKAIQLSLKEAQTHLADISYHYNRIKSTLLVNKLEIHRIRPDGDCLFNAIIFNYINKDSNVNAEAFRNIVADHISQNMDAYKSYISEDETSLEESISLLRIPTKWNIQGISDIIPHAVSNLLNIPITIYSSHRNQRVINIIPTLQSPKPNTERCCIRLAHLAMDNVEHYDAVIDPSDRLSLKLSFPICNEVVDDVVNDMDMEIADSPETNDSSEQIIEKRRTRKRKSNPDEWKKNIKKNKRQLGEEYVSSKGAIIPARNVLPQNCEKCPFECSNKISDDERSQINKDFWALGSNDRQRDFILNNVESYDVKSRKIGPTSKRERNTARKYHLNKVRVCKSFFLKTLNISHQRVTTAFMKKTDSNTASRDERGHHTPSNKTPEALHNYVKSHIDSFPRMESHYCRADSKREYLQPDLNLRIMYDLYVKKTKEEGVQCVSSYVYREIFNSEFNLSFSKPKKDLCDFCHKYKNGGDVQKEEYDRHMKNKQSIYEIKQKDKEAAQNDKTIHVACFDMEQILQVPNTNLGILYYSRKHSVYNCSVYSLGNKDASCYVWSEVQGGRGSCEVATCIFQHIKSLPASVQHVILYSDTCGGQNRNKQFLTMLKYAVEAEPNLKTIEHKFMEKGHSHFEVDSVHSAIETRKATTSAYIPRDYYNIMKLARPKQPYTVIPMENEDFIDFKGFAISKTDEKSQKVRWLEMKEVKVSKGDDSFYIKYNHDDPYIEVPQRATRNAQDLSSIAVKQLFEGLLPITKEKKKDLMSLCKNRVIPLEYHAYYKGLPCSSED